MMSDRMVGFLPGRWHRRSSCCWLRSVHSPCCLDENATLRVGQSTQNCEAPRNGPEEASAKAAETPSELGVSARRLTESIFVIVPVVMFAALVRPGQPGL